MTKQPPLVPQFSQVATFRVPSVAAVPCRLMSKLSSELEARKYHQQPTIIPPGSRFLRFADLPPKVSMGDDRGQQSKKSRVAPEWSCEVISGLHWDYLTFIACEAGHPLHLCNQVPEELKMAVEKNIEGDSAKMAECRIDWCRRWLKRCSALELAEKEEETTKMKRLLVEGEMFV